MVKWQFVYKLNLRQETQISLFELLITFFVKIDIAFKIKKYSEEFILSDWKKIDLNTDYESFEQEVDRKKFVTS